MWFYNNDSDNCKTGIIRTYHWLAFHCFSYTMSSALSLSAISFNIPPINPIMESLPSPFHREGTWDRERFNNLSKVMKLTGSGRTESQIQLQSPWPSWLFFFLPLKRIFWADVAKFHSDQTMKTNDRRSNSSFPGTSFAKWLLFGI